MSEHTARIDWQHTEGEFLKGRFSRKHTWTFDGGLSVPASASPQVVPAPLADPSGIDPEEAFVASLASCHMLTFLFLAYRGEFAVSSYTDDAVGFVEKNAEGTPWVSRVVLNPKVEFSGDSQPDDAELQELHESAHRQCFISNSVRTEVTVRPVDR
jgi:organic hydroperoxide reductase OsmC/OhrA